MLTPDYLEHVADEVIELYSEFEQTIIKDIVKRLLKTNLLVPSVNHQVKVLQESGILYNDIIKEISKITGKSEEVIKKIFEDSAIKSITLDDNIYKQAGLNPLPFNQSESVLEILIAGLSKTNKQVNNLTMTLAGNSQAKFTNAVNLAYMQITTGAFDRNTAILNAVKNLSDDGLDIVYPSGKVSKVDVAVRRAVLTGVSQTCGKMQEIRADEMNCDLMELTAHPGARVTEKNDYTNHSWWQGRIVSRSGKKGYLSLEDIGYGEVTGFLGINCRHGWFPFYEGITERRYTDEELVNINNQTVKYKNEDIGLYEVTKKQREKERNIRRLKREVGVYEEILANTDDEDLRNATNVKYNYAKDRLKNAQNDLKDFIEETELRRDYTRERVVSSKIDKTKANKNDIIEIPEALNKVIREQNINEKTETLFNKYLIEENVIIDSSNSKPMYYSQDKDKIIINLEHNDLKYYKLDQALSHEIIHMLDKRNNIVNNSRDFIIEKLNKAKLYIKNNYSYYYGIMNNEEYSSNMALSDIFSYLTDGKLKGDFGHSLEYWANDDIIANETLANILSSYITDDNKLFEIIDDIKPLKDLKEEMINIYEKLET